MSIASLYEMALCTASNAAADAYAGKSSWQSFMALAISVARR
jgi:hypothetical protein